MDALRSLGIDPHGLVLYLVNFGILLAVLLKFVYRPVIKAVDERRETIRRSLREAEELRVRFAGEAKAQQDETQRVVREMQGELASTRALAEERGKKILAEAQTRRGEMIEEARAIIATMKDRIAGEVEEEVKAKMEAVILHVLKEDVPKEAVKKSVLAAWKDASRA